MAEYRWWLRGKRGGLIALLVEIIPIRDKRKRYTHFEMHIMKGRDRYKEK